jgi:AcrR family transcriptional regulator
MLLDAADRLLADHETTDVGLYDIAAAAEVPPASVYHLFPTKEAALVALAERYLRGMSDFMVRPEDVVNYEKWQDFIGIEMGRAGQFYNEHPVMAKLFFGANVVREVRTLDARNVEAASGSIHQRMNEIFEMPYLRNSDVKFATMIGIYDGVWMTSYSRHGHITEPFAREAETAAIAYCGTFLPAVVPLRRPRRVSEP